MPIILLMDQFIEIFNCHSKNSASEVPEKNKKRRL